MLLGMFVIIATVVFLNRDIKLKRHRELKHEAGWFWFNIFK